MSVENNNNDTKSSMANLMEEWKKLALNSNPDLWDQAVLDLECQGGMAVVELPLIQQDIHLKCFEVAKKAFDTPIPKQHMIPPNADSAHVTGYHSSTTGSMSRYNAYREGFVFSNGNLIDMDSSFRGAMQLMFQSMHDGIAQKILDALERRWKLPQNWFQNALGPTGDSSQWHVKRYVTPEDNENEEETNENEKEAPSSSTTRSNSAKKEENEIIWLPVHTDPSLISIVLHDAPGKQEGAMGLQYQAPAGANKKKRVWVEVPYHGHAVATIFVGSVLSYITGSKMSSAKHRVVYKHFFPKDRVAATLFVRPKGTAMLQVPPSPLLKDIVLRKSTDFSAWSARVSRNYQKQKKEVTKQPKGNTESKTESQNGDDKDPAINYEHNNDIYYRDDYTELTLLPCDPPLTGREKFLGGELADNGKIYTIPGHAKRVVVIDPNMEPPTVKPIMTFEQSGEFKWLRGVRMKTGIIYGIPCHADAVLRIDPSTDTVTTLEWDWDDPMAPPKGLPWKWHGGNIAPCDGILYCIPQFAKHVLKIDPDTEKLSFINCDYEGTNKWYGGLVGKDGAIYGINQNATGVLKIDPLTQTTSIHGSFPEGGYKWHGGVVGPDGNIYGIPAHADTVLCVEPGSPPTITTMGGPLRTGQHRSDGKYKYLGGAVGHDGNVYFFPSDADHVLQLNPDTKVVREVGPNLRELEPIHHNKWQNGFTAKDGSMYGIPLKATTVIRIRPQPNGDPEICTIGGPYNGLNSWEGGVMGKNGDMFCMPLNHSKVLRIRPVTSDSNNALETGQVEGS